MNRLNFQGAQLKWLARGWPDLLGYTMSEIMVVLVVSVLVAVLVRIFWRVLVNLLLILCLALVFAGLLFGVTGMHAVLQSG